MDEPVVPAKHSRRGLLVIALIIAVAVALVLWHVLKRKPAEQHAQAQVVTVAAAALGDMPQTLSALGTVTPPATVTVLPMLSGYLTQVGFKEGQDVEKGQFLAQIDPRQYEISKAQAEAQLGKDQAALEQARSDLARYAQLNEQHSIAEQTFTNQQFVVHQAEAAVKADKAQIAQYALDLEYCRITAPVAGRAGLRLVDAGNYVTSGSSTGIVVITQIKPTTVQFAVPQNALESVIDRFNKNGNKLPVFVFGADNTKQIATGELYAIGNQMATGTGTVMLRANFPNQDEALFPNEFVNVKLLVDTLHDAVLVPTPAVQTGAAGTFVYLVNDDAVSVHPVTTGPSDGKHTVILTGLSQGQKVVVDGTDRLSDGAKIRVPRADEKAGGGASGSADGDAAAAAGKGAGEGNHHRRAGGANGDAQSGQKSSDQKPSDQKPSDQKP